MDAIKAFLDANHLIMDVVVVTLVVAALHRNYLHKAFTIGAGCFALSKVCEPTTLQYAAFALVAYFVPPLISPIYKKQPETGAVFVTGADSGMGEATVLHLCKASGYDRVYAGCFSPASEAKLRKQLDAAQGKCALPSFDPAEAVRTWRQRTARKLWQPTAGLDHGGEAAGVALFLRRPRKLKLTERNSPDLAGCGSPLLLAAPSGGRASSQAARSARDIVDAPSAAMRVHVASASSLDLPAFMRYRAKASRAITPV